MITTDTKQKAAGAINTNGPHTHTNSADFRTGDPIAPALDCKAIATLTARLALAGHAVHPLSDGGYLVSKYGYTHHAKDFTALQAFATRLGVTQ